MTWWKETEGRRRKVTSYFFFPRTVCLLLMWTYFFASGRPFSIIIMLRKASFIARDSPLRRNSWLSCWSVWIELILLKLKTENWKHCSKIIFKCVNSTVGPIFNEKIDKKWNLWVREQCTDALFTQNWSKVAATVH